MKRVLNTRYDLSGNDIARLFRLAAIGKILPLGNLRGGPGLRCLVVLSLLHYLGYPLYYINAKYGDRLSGVRTFIRRIRQRNR